MLLNWWNNSSVMPHSHGGKHTHTKKRHNCGGQIRNSLAWGGKKKNNQHENIKSVCPGLPKEANIQSLNFCLNYQTICPTPISQPNQSRIWTCLLLTLLVQWELNLHYQVGWKRVTPWRVNISWEQWSGNVRALQRVTQRYTGSSQCAKRKTERQQSGQQLPVEWMVGDSEKDMVY